MEQEKTLETKLPSETVNLHFLFLPSNFVISMGTKHGSSTEATRNRRLGVKNNPLGFSTLCFAHFEIVSV